MTAALAAVTATASTQATTECEQRYAQGDEPTPPPGDVGRSGITTAHAALDPIAAILSFYVMAAGLAAARGRNPDAPRHLNKVTETH